MSGGIIAFFIKTREHLSLNAHPEDTAARLAGQSEYHGTDYPAQERKSLSTVVCI